ncbi:MAG: 4-(cytidine 5'-diphospho)-2-C-methyl-D-erythritol kinase [Erysipelotrichaceae bacterium]|nr:4-(cytidine 5'-diphospho)-2-C-methyl-D-erythritol kinase [Erysipelotrichaceae bacterium]
MEIRAYCKVNLALDVIGKREDGYHELRMIMVPVNFYDDIKIEKNDTMVYECTKGRMYFDSSNTIVKAVEIMKEEFGIEDNFKVSIAKHLPMKAGLAGGSTDGAAIIRAINKMYKLNLGAEKIKELCLKIGADVLFNYYSKPALVEGLGDKLTFIDIKDDYYILIVKPRGGVSTKECYGSLDLNNAVHPDVDTILEKLKNGEEVKDLLSNTLEKPAIELCREIRNAKEDLIKAGADFAMVSGSGSSVFTIDKDEKKILELREKLRGKPYFIRSSKLLK